MSKKRIPRSTVDMFYALFSMNSSIVQINGKSSRLISHPAGVQQGSILSPFLYSVFIDDLPNKLREGPTIKVDNLKINCLLYADDLAIIARDDYDLATLLNLAEQHAIGNYYQFNCKKCVIVNSKYGHTIHQVTIPVATTFPYLGVFLISLEFPQEISQLNLP